MNDDTLNETELLGIRAVIIKDLENPQNNSIFNLLGLDKKELEELKSKVEHKLKN